MNQLEQLKAMTTVVADTGDIDSIRQYAPQDATTNPSLIYKAAQMDAYRDLVDDAVAFGHGDVEAVIDKLFVNFGREILNLVPGRVSTEVDAALSFDTQASIDKARGLIKLYEEAGIGRERVLIKLAGTWEGLRAADVLEDEAIHCNLTLLFALPQAIAAADAGVTLISPFVGRIYDWYKAEQGVDDIPADEDPGVASVTEIYTYLKKFDSPMEVMGASFRKREQIVGLAGCDLLTISPDLLEALAEHTEPIERKLDEAEAKAADVERIEMDEATFRWMMNEDAMATEKLAEGIRRFNADLNKLRESIAARAGAAA